MAASDSPVRKALFWVHLATGVVVGAVVLVMAVTGTLLTFQKQMTTWADLRGLDGAPPVAAATDGAPPVAAATDGAPPVAAATDGAPPVAAATDGGSAIARLPIDSLVARAAAHVANVEAKPTAVTLRNGADAPVEVAFGRERRVFVNAYTGAVLGDGSRAMRAFFTVVTDWHRWLAMAGERRATGKAITGAANLGFLLLVLSGMYLWIPRSRAALRSVLAFRRGLAGKARDFNWHNVIGIWSAIPLAIVVASGVVISYPWASALVYRAYGEQAPAPSGPPAGGAAGGARNAGPSLGGLDDMVRTAQRVADERMGGWRTIALTLPTADTGRVQLALDRGMGGEPQKRATLTLDRATGAVRKLEAFGDLTPARRARSVLRFAHTGEVLGPIGQLVAGLVSLGTAFLVYTGIALAARRLWSWRRRRERVVEAERLAA